MCCYCAFWYFDWGVTVTFCENWKNKVNLLCIFNTLYTSTLIFHLYMNCIWCISPFSYFHWGIIVSFHENWLLWWHDPEGDSPRQRDMPQKGIPLNRDKGCPAKPPGVHILAQSLFTVFLPWIERLAKEYHLAWGLIEDWETLETLLNPLRCREGHNDCL